MKYLNTLDTLELAEVLKDSYEGTIYDTESL